MESHFFDSHWNIWDKLNITHCSHHQNNIVYLVYLYNAYTFTEKKKPSKIGQKTVRHFYKTVYTSAGPGRVEFRTHLVDICFILAIWMGMGISYIYIYMAGGEYKNAVWLHVGWCEYHEGNTCKICEKSQQQQQQQYRST